MRLFNSINQLVLLSAHSLTGSREDQLSRRLRRPRPILQRVRVLVHTVYMNEPNYCLNHVRAHDDRESATINQ